MAQIVLAYDRSPQSTREYFADTELIAELIARFNVVIKIGLQAMTAHGPRDEESFYSFGELLRSFVYECKGTVLWDGKYKDIGNTTVQAVSNMAGRANGLTIHADRNVKWLKRIVAARDEAAAGNPALRPTLFGVTLLTDTNDRESDYLYSGRASVVVEKRLHALIEAEFDGVVCSGQELDLVNRLDPSRELTRLVPGCRPTWAEANDQERVMTPKEAKDLGADLLVFGRPVWNHPNPLKAVDLLMIEINS